MSDLNDLIATNAVRAYNQGVERGAAKEQDRIIELLEGYLQKLLHNHGLIIIPEQFDYLIALIKGEQK